ncbi:MAG: thioredoxin domain-containing protein [Chloroflexi bacterium]|nr:thioredoxin domain-containing protein [Chloroflexota bacterium]
MPKVQQPLSKRQIIKQERLKKQKRQRYFTILIVAALAVVVVAILFAPSLFSSMKNPSSRPNANLNAMGDPNAPVKIEEFSDFQCPYCKRFADQTEPLIVENYVATGKVYFVYNAYGPGGRYIGPESVDATIAAFCAGDQNKFWEYKDILFAHHTGENVGDYTSSKLETFAKDIGLDMDKYYACIKENPYEQKIADGFTAGINAGIDGTPAFLINGKLIVGALPYEEFQKEIEAALAAAGQ